MWQGAATAIALPPYSGTLPDPGRWGASRLGKSTQYVCCTLARNGVTQHSAATDTHREGALNRKRLQRAAPPVNPRFYPLDSMHLRPIVQETLSSSPMVLYVDFTGLSRPAKGPHPRGVCGSTTWLRPKVRWSQTKMIHKPMDHHGGAPSSITDEHPFTALD